MPGGYTAALGGYPLAPGGLPGTTLERLLGPDGAILGAFGRSFSAFDLTFERWNEMDVEDFVTDVFAPVWSSCVVVVDPDFRIPDRICRFTFVDKIRYIPCPT